MSKVKWVELSKEIDDTPKWLKELYKTEIISKKKFRVKKHNLAIDTWRVLYNDGSHIDGPKGYGDLKRKGVKSISVLSNNKPIHTVQVKDDFFVIRLRNLIRGLAGEGEDSLFGHLDPKRCFVLATKGNIAFVWDDGDIDELKDWGDQEPYRKPTYLSDEK